jgi:protocatechuate 3,4-dioxygenase beta subunit
MTRNYPSVSRRRFLVSSATLATTFQLQRGALAIGLTPNADVCRLVTEQEEGPYYVAEELVRSSIAEGKPGVPLSLRILLLDSRTCKPLATAAVDIWHCDALGLYSGFTQTNPTGPGGPGVPGGPPPGGPPPGFDPQHPEKNSGPPGMMGPPPHNHPTDKRTFLRGTQLTGSDGSVIFQTIFPGFYMGRTNHIHFKVRVGGAKSYAAGHTSHTGQIFFDEQVAIELMKHEPYSMHQIHRTTQTEDQVFNDQHGDLSIAQLRLLDPKLIGQGMHAGIVASVDPAAIPPAAQRRGGPGWATTARNGVGEFSEISNR